MNHDELRCVMGFDQKGSSLYGFLVCYMHSFRALITGILYTWMDIGHGKLKDWSFD